MNTFPGTLYIGTSGYQYDHWRGVFYPEDLPKRRWFEHYAQSFDTVEINNTFYRLPAAHTFDAWRERAPEGFVYVLKFSRFATHIKRLKDPVEPIQRFLESAMHLGDRLGPILVQLPPRFKVNPQRLYAFLEATPRSFRWVCEFREPDWLNEEVYQILETHGAALCIHDMLPDHPKRITADWSYLRFHGDHYQGSYTPQFLSATAGRIRDYLARGLDVYAYFNNDQAGYAVRNALDLRRYVAGHDKNRLKG
jgi:uncharacterized protein YecE (DUF72 family)